MRINHIISLTLALLVTFHQVSLITFAEGLENIKVMPQPRDPSSSDEVYINIIVDEAFYLKKPFKVFLDGALISSGYIKGETTRVRLGKLSPGYHTITILIDKEELEVKLLVSDVNPFFDKMSQKLKIYWQLFTSSVAGLLSSLSRDIVAISLAIFSRLASLAGLKVEALEFKEYVGSIVESINLVSVNPASVKSKITIVSIISSITTLALWLRRRKKAMLTFSEPGEAYVPKDVMKAMKDAYVAYRSGDFRDVVLLVAEKLRKKIANESSINLRKLDVSSLNKLKESLPKDLSRDVLAIIRLEQKVKSGYVCSKGEAEDSIKRMERIASRLSVKHHA